VPLGVKVGSGCALLERPRKPHLFLSLCFLSITNELTGQLEETVSKGHQQPMFLVILRNPWKTIYFRTHLWRNPDQNDGRRLVWGSQTRSFNHPTPSPSVAQTVLHITLMK
jgi:hypothetical protein